MNKNFLLGIAVGGVTVLAVYVMKKTEKHYISVEETTEDGETVVNEKEVEEPVITKEKIKAAFSKENLKAKTEKAMDYIVANQDKIQGLTTCISLLTALVGFRTAIRASIRKKDEEKRMDNMWGLLNSLTGEITHMEGEAA